MLRSLDQGGIHVGEAGSRSLDAWAQPPRVRIEGLKTGSGRCLISPGQKGLGKDWDSQGRDHGRLHWAERAAKERR